MSPPSGSQMRRVTFGISTSSIVIARAAPGEPGREARSEQPADRDAFVEVLEAARDHALGADRAAERLLRERQGVVAVRGIAGGEERPREVRGRGVAVVGEA